MDSSNKVKEYFKAIEEDFGRQLLEDFDENESHRVSTVKLKQP